MGGLEAVVVICNCGCRRDKGAGRVERVGDSSAEGLGGGDWDLGF